MTDPVRELFQAGLVGRSAFPPASRYHQVPTARLTAPDGRVVVYLRRRLIPPPERFALLREHTVRGEDRLDNLTAQQLGDPEQFWQICDANAVLAPGELVEVVGRRIRITLPAGIPGSGEGAPQ